MKALRILIKRPLYKGLITCCVALLLGTGQLFAQIPESEKQALLDIYKATDGANWEEDCLWDLSKTPDKWLGVTIKEGHVRGLSLSRFGLHGTLPGKAFAALPHLEEIFVDQNRDKKRERELSGPVPEEIMQLKKLKILFLGSCAFTGKLPSLNTLTSLEYLSIEMINLKNDPDGFSATLPDFEKLPNLVYFDASFSGLEGTISKGIGKCKNLILFDISCNRVEGPIPSELNQCTEIVDLSLQDNRLTGDIPDLSALTHIGDPSYPDHIFFGRLYLSENQLTGNFPEWITNLTNVKRFSISENKITGNIPSKLDGMQEVDLFYANDNLFEGELPSALPPKVSLLDLSHNKFKGSIPRSWEKATLLNKIILHHNLLTGEVPPIYKNLKGLDAIDVNRNNFSFVDFKEWKSFSTDSEAIFRFGMQNPYSEKKENSVASGATVEFDATYPSDIPASYKATYTWYSVQTMEEVVGAEKKPVLKLSNVAKKDAAKYVCFITTDYFGENPAGKNKSSETTTEETALLKKRTSRPMIASKAVSSEGEGGELRADYNPNLPPILPSGFFKLIVDGYDSVEETVGTSEKPFVYPSTLNQQFNIAHPEAVASVWVFDLTGRKIMAQAINGDTTVSVADLAPGNYVVMLLTKGEEWIQQQITIVR